MALIGNTVTLRAEFSYEENLYYDVENTKLTIYDERKRIILEVTEDELDKERSGVFVYNYTIPKGATPYYYEFSAEYDGKLLTGRRPLIREWIQEV